eukprot:TRINITY_DN68448_c0_g1_i1.p1 TRINITY_DN68448_c0_g1~~TRINITY_DN68448_c0_g1_i1.p1  ORF type:complete len:362 (-),score=95.19 TRINITY_DN68448_c0_g1_i1:76-1161(-)
MASSSSSLQVPAPIVLDDREDDDSVVISELEDEDTRDKQKKNDKQEMPKALADADAGESVTLHPSSNEYPSRTVSATSFLADHHDDDLKALKLNEIDLESVRECAEKKLSPCTKVVGDITRFSLFCEVFVSVLNFLSDVYLLYALYRKKFYLLYFTIYLIYFISFNSYGLKLWFQACGAAIDGDASVALVDPNLSSLLILKNKQYLNLMSIVEQNMSFIASITSAVYKRIQKTFFVTFYPINLLLLWWIPLDLVNVNHNKLIVEFKIILFAPDVVLLLLAYLIYPALRIWICCSKHVMKEKFQNGMAGYASYHINQALVKLVREKQIRTTRSNNRSNDQQPEPSQVTIIGAKTSPALVVSV